MLQVWENVKYWNNLGYDLASYQMNVYRRISEESQRKLKINEQMKASLTMRQELVTLS